MLVVFAVGLLAGVLALVTLVSVGMIRELVEWRRDVVGFHRR